VPVVDSLSGENRKQPAAEGGAAFRDGLKVDNARADLINDACINASSRCSGGLLGYFDMNRALSDTLDVPG
jgi:hypothetical protein